MLDSAPRLRGSAPLREVLNVGIRMVLAALILVGDSGVGATRSLWMDRRKAARSVREGARLSIADQLEESFPSLKTGLGPTDASGVPVWLENTVGLYADVGTYIPPASGRHRVLVHVQDLHAVEEAQRNIASLLNQLAGSVGGADGLWVGLEGAAGPFRTEDFRALAAPSVIRRVSDRFLRAGLLSGPEFFGLTTEHAYRLWGAEDPAAYEANIRALTRTFTTQSHDDAQLVQARRRVDRLKKTLYPPSLLALDEAKSAYEADQLSLTAYVQKISEYVSDQQMGPSLVRFREASRMESDLSLNGVESDQRRLMENLAPLLTDSELRRLTETGLACRLGRARPVVFLSVLKEICRQHRVDLGGYPHLLAHIAYVEKVDGLKADDLRGDIQLLLDHQMEVLAGEPVVAKTMELDRDLKLVEKLNRFTLLPTEFVKWNQRRAEMSRWAQRGSDLDRLAEKSMGVSVPVVVQRNKGGTESTPWPNISDVGDRHAAFYRWAELRNRPLVKNLLARWTDDRPAVLVAGGYHADGIRAVAQSEGVGYISLVPRVTRSQPFPPPLESFRSEGKTKRWKLPGPSSLQYRLQTADSEVGSVREGKVPFETAFIAAVYSVLVRDPESQSPLSAQAIEKLRDVARERFGIDLIQTNQSENGRHLVLSVRFLSAPGVPVYTVTMNTVGDREDGDVWVGIQPVQTWKQAAEFVRQTDDWISALRPAIQLWIVGVLPRVIDQIGLAFRRTAVFLIPTVRSAGGSGLMEYLGGVKDRWSQAILLAREREEVAQALTQTPDNRRKRLLALAANHTMSIPTAWVQSLTEALGVHEGAQLEDGKKCLRISLGEEGGPTLRLHVTSARALFERPAGYSPYQLERNPDEVVDVYLAEPVVSSPERLLPLVVGRMMREINGIQSGNHRLEELQILLGMWESLAQYSINSWASYISGIKLEPAVSIPTESLRTAWRPGRQLDFIEGTQPLIGNTGLFVLTGASPNSEVKSPALKVTLDAVVSHLSGMGLDTERAQGLARGLIEDRLERSIGLIEHFQEMANQRGLLTRLSWRVNRQALANSGSDLVIELLKHVGASQGQIMALNGTPFEKALESQMTDQFPYLAQTLLGIMKMAGEPLDRASPDDQRARLADMWTVYAEHFSIGYQQLSSVYSASFGTTLVDRVDGVLAGVFHLANVSQVQSLDRVIDVLLNRDVNRFKTALLVPREEIDSVVRNLIDRLRTRDLSDDQRQRVETILGADNVLLISAGNERIQLDTVFQQLKDQWENVIHADVYTANAAVFDMTVATLLSWSVYENGILISKSVESAAAEQRIRAFLQQQA